MAPQNDARYILNPNVAAIKVKGRKESLSISIDKFLLALELANRKMNALQENAPDLFEILGLRNLSAFVGEMFVRALLETTDSAFVKNPHQDGYPDLLLMPAEGKTLWKQLKDKRQDKEPFSNFATGGVEVKATCGSLPTPEKFRKKGIRKPEIGDSRIVVVTGYDWKAHHRETNNLIGVFWDFVHSKPIICGVFYSGKLNQTDWGKIVSPKINGEGGRTTSVSIMSRQGILKMYENWIAVIDDIRYAQFFDKFNKSSLIVDAMTR